MKKYVIYSTLLTMIFVFGVIYGIVIHKHKIFPYRIIKMAYQPLKPDETYAIWSIGIYEGSAPFDLEASKNNSNPVLTRKDVVDVDANFVADPFMALKNGKYYLFFEVMNRETNQGDISFAESTDGKDWEYRKVIIDEKFHLSYPYVFEWDNDYYLIPESNEDLSVRLYKAVSFPDKWKYVGNILTGYRYVDPSIFRHNDKWWIFVSNLCNGVSDVLSLYYSNDLLGEWKAHPRNPIVKFDRHIARPGGRVTTHDGRLYRLAQDGKQVLAFEITELTVESYAEKIVSEKAVVSMSGKGWNAAGMHHVDLHQIGDKWMAVVDGKDRP